MIYSRGIFSPHQLLCRPPPCPPNFTPLPAPNKRYGLGFNKVLPRMELLACDLAALLLYFEINCISSVHWHQIAPVKVI